MGITGLLPILKPAIKIVSLINYKNKTIGIDGHSWLYQMAHAFAEDIFYGIPTRKHVTPFLAKIMKLKSHKIKPIFVFDGDSLPSKDVTNNARSERKKKIRAEIIMLLKKNDIRRAKNLMRQCVSITTEYLSVIIDALRKENIEYIISPYESDAQLCYLQKIGYIDYIMTEDSDLVPYGSDKILYKFDGGKVHEFKRNLLDKVKDKFFAENILDICIFSGCDYLQSIKGIGLLTAYKYMLKYKSVENIVNELKKSKDIPENYLIEFERAKITFLEHIVYDPLLKKRIHLSGKDSLEAKENYHFLGEIGLEDEARFSFGYHLFEKKGPLDSFGVKIEFKQPPNIIKEKKIKMKHVLIDRKKETKEIIVDENEYSPLFNKKIT